MSSNFFEICAILANNQELILHITKNDMANYIGDNNKKQVHDLENLKDNCQMDEIKLVHRRYFIPDSFKQANSEGYTSCAWCIENFQK